MKGTVTRIEHEQFFGSEAGSWITLTGIDGDHKARQIEVIVDRAEGLSMNVGEVWDVRYHCDHEDLGGAMRLREITLTRVIKSGGWKVDGKWI